MCWYTGRTHISSNRPVSSGAGVWEFVEVLFHPEAITKTKREHAGFSGEFMQHTITPTNTLRIHFDT